MADLTKYAKGKRMVQEDKIKQIEQNTKDIEEIGELLEITPTVYYTNDITNLSKDFLNGLLAGDIVIKQTGSGAVKQNHAYRVSFKKNTEGICLTYTDASCSETVSYDKSGLNWHYNSTDVTTFSDFATKDELPAEVEAITPTGTEEALEGLKIGDTSYKIGGGDETHLYEHNFYIPIFWAGSGTPDSEGSVRATIISTKSNNYGYSGLISFLKSYHNTELKGLPATGNYYRGADDKEYPVDCLFCLSASNGIYVQYGSVKTIFRQTSVPSDSVITEEIRTIF